MNNCKTCSKNCIGEYCFLHKPKKKLASKKLYPKPISIEKINEVFENTKKMKEFFWSIWEKRPHKSELNGEILFSPPSSAYFHHIIPKENCEQGKFDEENIIILSIDQHTNCHSDMYRYEIINEKRELLLTKYNLK